MTQQTEQTNVTQLPKVKVVMTLSVIAIICGVTILGSFIGIVLAIIALVKGDKAQDVYLTNPAPENWSNYSALQTNMIFAIISFIINALITANILGYAITRTIADYNMHMH